MHVRRKLVAGNWKMNGSLAALGRARPRSPPRRARRRRVDVAICPPFTLIPLAVARAGGLAIGAPGLPLGGRAAPIPATSRRRC